MNKKQTENMANNENNQNLRGILRRRRLTMSLTLHQLATISGISSSHLGRIEKGERFPSAQVLRKIAQPLGFAENELFSLAGYLSLAPTRIEEARIDGSGRQLDPYISNLLKQEPVEVQRAVTGILIILKSIAKTLGKENKND